MQHEPVKITIVTATRNRRDWLERCLESVTAQDYPSKEHVVIDGASTDGTADFLRDYAARHPHVRWISEPDKGLSDALNKGMSMATGDWIGVLGDDDLSVPGAFAVVDAEARAAGDAGLIAGDCE